MLSSYDANHLVLRRASLDDITTFRKKLQDLSDAQAQSARMHRGRLEEFQDARADEATWAFRSTTEM